MRNLTLAEEAKAGNIYLVDYKILEGKQDITIQNTKYRKLKNVFLSRILQNTKRERNNVFL